MCKLLKHKPQNLATMPLPNGVYHIQGRKAPNVVDLGGGLVADGSPIITWERLSLDKSSCLNQLWYVENVRGSEKDYTIVNIRSGTNMVVKSGKDGALVGGYHHTDNANQQWTISKPNGSEYFKIQNKAERTFLDIPGGKHVNGIRLHCWHGGWDEGNINQLWTFRCHSRTSQEIDKVLNDDPNIRHKHSRYLTNGTYFVLSQAMLREIWNHTGLGNTHWRRQIFDCDDFAIVFKAAVAKWGAENIRANGFAILCGLMFGRKPGGEVHAYNFTLSDSYHDVEFFEPQKGHFTRHIGYNADLCYF
ncbi:ricin B-like lectin [Rickenella mellea]|uniref:Ricin B-like lectin n=1 Tax=Rickenella mellea TaxID=50990 RepID=A0A4Y7PI42_9AGAM|nr:ricin B-like lectin [Rickenella mellea]